MNVLLQKLVLIRMLQNEIQTFLKVVPRRATRFLGSYFLPHYEKIKRRERKPKNKILVPHVEDTVGAKMWCRQKRLTMYNNWATSSPPFSLRDSRASKTRARVKITPREKRRHAAGREKNEGSFFSLPAVC